MGGYETEMASRSLCAPVLLIALLTAACQTPAAVGPAGARGTRATPTARRGGDGDAATSSPQPPGPTVIAGLTPSPGASPTLAPAPAVGLAGSVRAPATLLANNGAGLISDRGAGIVANHGAGVVANNGGSIIANNGGALIGKTKYGQAAYGLRQTVNMKLEQFLLTGVEVALVGADGVPLKDGAGNPLVARTDAEGRYALPAAPPDRNAVLVVKLPGDKGELRAIAPRAAGGRTVEVDVVSTFATSYILTQYIGTQADKQGTLDKLPADAEAETRRRTAQAYAAAGAPPAAVTDAAVVAAVDALRGQSGELDAQLETVRRLLIPAGQSDLGAGLPGTEVSLAGVGQLALAPDGTLLFATSQRAATVGNRIWRLGADGRLAKVADVQARGLAVAPDGTIAWTEVTSVENPFVPGRVRLWRQPPGGVPTAVAQDVKAGDLPLFGPADALVLFTGLFGWGTPQALVYQGGGAPREVSMSAGSPGTLAGGPVAQDAAGGTWMLSGRGKDAVLWTIDLTSGEAVARATGAELGARSLALDARGDLIYLAAGGLLRRTPAGATSVLWAAPPAALALEGGVALAPDGKLFVAQGGSRIFALAAGEYRAVAGKAADATAATAARLDLVAASGVGATVDGTLFVADAGAHRIYRVGTDGAVTTFAGTSAAGSAPDGTQAAAASLTSPSDLVIDQAGRLVFIDGKAVRRADPAAPGAPLETLFAAEKTTPSLLTCGPDGMLYFRTVTTATGGAPNPFDVGTFKLQAVRPDGTRQDLLASDPALEGFHEMAASAEGLVLLDGYRIDRWTPATGRVRVAELPGKPANGFPPMPAELVVGTETVLGLPGGLAVGPRGLLYLTFPAAGGNRVVRFDPATGALAVIAGKGAAVFNGDGVDDGLDQPIRPAFDAAGHLLVVDANHRQIKRIPAEKL